MLPGHNSCSRVSLTTFLLTTFSITEIASYASSLVSIFSLSTNQGNFPFSDGAELSVHAREKKSKSKTLTWSTRKLRWKWLMKNYC